MTQQARALAHTNPIIRDIALVVSASIFVAIAAHISIRLPFSPVPFTLQDLAVLLVGLTLGSKRGAAALFLYLAEGAAGLPVFASAAGPSGIAHLFGPTGGYLLAYPAVAYVAGLPVHIGSRFLRSLIATASAQLVLYVCGASWLAFFLGSFRHAVSVGVLPFLPFAVAKIVLASLAGTRLLRQS